MEPQIFNITVSGKPDGIKVIESPLWKLAMIVAPRTDMKNLAVLPEAKNPGVYILFGQGDDPILESAYIGKSSEVSRRLDQHDLKKEFWDTAVFFVGNLSSSTNDYLEHELHTLSKSAGRYFIENEAVPPTPGITDGERTLAKHFLKQIQVFLNVLDYPLLEKIPLEDESLPAQETAKEYHLKLLATDAHAVQLEGKTMKVLAGSLARRTSTPGLQPSYINMRDKLVTEGTFKIHDENSYVLVKDVVFKSPSGAGSTMSGRPMNGWDTWIGSNGKTLDENSKE